MKKKPTYHQYPPLLYRKPFIIHLLYIWNNLTLHRNWYVHRYFNRLLKKLPQGGQVLDAGFGEGQHLFPFTKRYPQLQFFGLDIIEENVTFGISYRNYFNLQNLQLIHNDLAVFKHHKKFDLALCVGVLPYVPDDAAIIHNTFKLLNSNGHFLLYTPIHGRSILRFYRWLQKKLYNYEDSFKKHKNYSPEEVTTLLERAGFSIEKQVFTYGTLGIISHEIYISILNLSSNTPSFLGFFWLTLNLLLLPFLLILKGLDYVLPKKTGNGFLIIGRKP